MLMLTTILILAQGAPAKGAVKDLAADVGRFQVTNAITQLTIFYVVFFAPILLPKEQLPSLLEHVSTYMPTTYAADAMRASLTDLPGTNLGKDLAVLAAFATGSLALASTTIRRRG